MSNQTSGRNTDTIDEPIEDMGPWKAVGTEEAFHSISIKGQGLGEEVWLSVRKGNLTPFPSEASVQEIVSAFKARGWEVDDWRGTQPDVTLYSDDFTHDASLRVGGDFGSPETRIAYGERLAERLNTPATAITPAQLVDAVRLVTLLSRAVYESEEEMEKLSDAVEAGNRRYLELRLRHPSFSRADQISKAEALAKLLGLGTAGIEQEVDARIAQQNARLRIEAMGEARKEKGSQE